MSDFFSFEYIDEQPYASNDILAERGAYRKNQSLSQASTEYLREAMKRLVPSTYMYGESGIGNRAYELYGILYGLAFSGNRSAHLVAALCVMHASYERRSDLVILPTDLEQKYADMKIPQMSYSKILNTYDRMCRELGVTKLEASMEKVIERIFRYGCRFDAESRISQYTHTAMKLYQTVVLAYPPRPENPSGRRTNYQNQTRPATIGVICAVLSTRVHLCRDVRISDMTREMGIHPRVFYKALTRFLDMQSGDVTDVGDDVETDCAKNKKRKSFTNLVIGGIEIPAAMSRGTLTKAERRRLYQESLNRPRDESFILPSLADSEPSGHAQLQYSQTVPSHFSPMQPIAAHSPQRETLPFKPANDPLGFLFEDFSDLLEREQVEDVAQEEIE